MYTLHITVQAKKDIIFLKKNAGNSKEEKLKLPQFGIGKSVGEKENTQIYPTIYIVAELDTPFMLIG
ncbi:MAG: hypothetical protein U9N53_02405 [Bacteroidota bacterium]|nr:hypothetical protein [Bacteroidota bacterium]